MRSSQALATRHSAGSLAAEYRAVRAFTERICAPLEVEDHVIQPHPDVSPPKWHLGHTTWFFESFLLQRFDPAYEVFHPRFAFLFNSYYESVGARVERPLRGMLSRPTLREVLAYRHSVDAAMRRLFETLPAENAREFSQLVEIGLHHEQQHQELLFTDLKNILFQNPLQPTYLPHAASLTNTTTVTAKAASMLPVPGGIHQIGVNADEPDFAYDNESPRHKVFLNAFRISNRPVTCGEYLEFIRDGAYQDFRHWLSDGWTRVCSEGWRAPLYWLPRAGETARDASNQSAAEFELFTLGGVREIDPNEPVCHISYYEAAAYASWAGRRLPSEAEWEAAVQHFGVQPDHHSNVAGTAEHPAQFPERFHPAPAQRNDAGEPTPLQMFGDVWEWTGSAYLAYPGYRSLDGALGEYNGKFMSDQMVLRGGSCATPVGHIRATYRNFFQPYQRWQFSGVRLAEDAGESD